MYSNASIIVNIIPLQFVDDLKSRVDPHLEKNRDRKMNRAIGEIG
jgi:hypothetical protein